jgi:imidazolonepropionase-like amidohydrolase
MRACTLLLAALTLAGLSASGQVAPRETLAIVRAKAYLNPGQAPVENATIVIVNGRVVAAGVAVQVPHGTRTIDAMGRIVTPGLMNSDSQMGLVETGTADTTDAAVTTGRFGSAFDVRYALNPNSTLLPVARADGLTRAIVLPTGSASAPFNGLGAVLRLSEGPNILDVPGAAMVVEVGGMVVPKSGGSRSAQWMSIRSALEEARQLASPDGSHGRKPQGPAGEDAAPAGALSRTNLDALLPVIERRIPLVILASRESDLREAVAVVDDYKIRVVLIGAEEGWRVADLLASRHIPVVLDPFASTPATYDQMGASLDNAALLDRAGVVISFKAAFVHVSYNAGIAIRIGAGVAVANGLPWAHALMALTVNPAKTWGIDDHYGTLQPGQEADLVLWDGDPFEPVSAPVLLLIQGRQISLDTRQRALERRYSPDHAHDPIPPGFR